MPWKLLLRLLIVTANLNNKILLEFVFAISLISFGSNQTFFFPHRITEAASLFCNFNELEINNHYMRMFMLNVMSIIHRKTKCVKTRHVVPHFFFKFRLAKLIKYICFHLRKEIISPRSENKCISKFNSFLTFLPHFAILSIALS